MSGIGRIVVRQITHTIPPRKTFSVVRRASLKIELLAMSYLVEIILAPQKTVVSGGRAAIS